MNIPTLETERLILREWRANDLDRFAAFRADKHMTRFIRKLNRDESWAHICFYMGHWTMRGFGPWCLTRKDSGEQIGYCGPYFPHDWPEAEISWAIYSDHQRQGFATEAAKASLRFAYEALHWKTAISLIADENSASIAVAKRIGAQEESAFTRRNIQCTIYRHLPPSQFLKH